MKNISTPIVVDPDSYNRITDNVAKAIASVNIQGLIGRVIVDVTGKVPTACWNFNPETKQYIIKLGYELLLKLDTDEISGIIEHELLHHVYYRRCSTRNAIMSNIVLDVAINKILYLCNPMITESWARKVYSDLGELIKSPVVLACPFLDYDQIQSIPDEMLRATYIDIWGSRKTALDFNSDVPVPLTLYYKLIKLVPREQTMFSPFGEDADEDDNQEDADDQNEEQSGKQTKKRKRCDDEATDDKQNESGGKDDESDDSDNSSSNEESDSADDSSDKEESDNSDSSGKQDNDDDSDDKEKSDESGDDDKSEQDSSDSDVNDKKANSNDSEDDISDSDGSDNKQDSYSECDDPAYDELKEFADEKEKEASQAGQGKSKISFARPPDIDFNCAEIDDSLREHMLEETINEVSEAIIGNLADDIIRLPYITRPTRTTLTHMACGVTDYLPIYYNHKGGEAKPKVACYVDVSVSMRGSMGLVHNIMNKIGEFLPSASFVFHDCVMPMPTVAWNNVVPLGGGTNFNNVFAHICMSIEDKKEWFEAWTEAGSRYQRHDSVESTLSGWMQEYGVHGDLVSEDFPVVVIITDGDAKILKDYKKLFLQQAKRLVVLLITNNVKREHVFSDIAETVIKIGTDGKILEKITQIIDKPCSDS